MCVEVTQEDDRSMYLIEEVTQSWLTLLSAWGNIYRYNRYLERFMDAHCDELQRSVDGHTFKRYAFSNCQTDTVLPVVNLIAFQQQRVIFADKVRCYSCLPYLGFLKCNHAGIVFRN